MSRVVIVGASVGGIKTAQALRAGGFDGQIIVVDQEHISRPYDKPPLSKAYLGSNASIDSIHLLRDDDFEGLQIDWRFGIRATGLAAERNVLQTDAGEIPYDHLVIATGSRARPSPWGEGPGIHVLRTREDAERLRAALGPGKRLLIFGGGFVGAEVAATALGAGGAVTIVDPRPTPMARAIDEQVGHIFLQKHISEGVRAVFGQTITGIEQRSLSGTADASPGDGREIVATLSGGERIEADAILVGIGAEVNTEWLEGSALTLDNGVVCDAQLRADGTVGVYAVGDVCRWRPDEGDGNNSRGTVRLEHWTNATDQAVVAAHNILHPHETRGYTPAEYVWSDQFDWKIQVVGHTCDTGSEVIGDPASGRFAVVYSNDGMHATGAVVVNWPRSLIACRRTVGAGGEITELVESLRALPPVKAA